MEAPKLRSLDVRPIEYEGRPYLLVRDPLVLNDQTLLLPQPLASALAFFDGTHKPSQIPEEISRHIGLRIQWSEIEQLINALDMALLLDNERSRQAHDRKLQEYRKAPFRKPTLAGTSYPDQPDDFRRYLQAFVEKSASDLSLMESSPITGLVSPHIDYARGGEAYAQTWAAAADSVRQADLAVILGTDHYSSNSDLTLTRQHYATPLGELPTAIDIVDALAGEIGEDRAFSDELRHVGEHSIELAAGWLHFLRDGEPVELVPILCGSFLEFIEDGRSPDTNRQIQRSLEVMKEQISGRRALVIASGDLSHAGSAFGGKPLELQSASRIKETDHRLIDLISAGDARGFYEAIAVEHDRNNVCGLAPIYLALKVLEPARGEPVAYQRCPADESGGSLVSICGVTLHADNGG